MPRIPCHKADGFPVQAGDQPVFIGNFRMTVKEIIGFFPILIPDLPVPFVKRISINKNVVKRSLWKVRDLPEFNHPGNTRGHFLCDTEDFFRQQDRFPLCPFLVPEKYPEAGMHKFIVGFLRIDLREDLPVIVQGSLRVRLLHHQLIEELLFFVRPLKESANRDLRLRQHYQYMPGVRNPVQGLDTDVRIHKDFLSVHLRFLQQLFDHLQLHSLAFLLHVPDPCDILIWRSADELMPVLQVPGVGQVRKLPAVQFRQFRVMVVFLQRDAVMLLCKILHQRGFACVGCPDHKVYAAQIHMCSSTKT